jgi:hypothetical protein
MAFVHLVGLQGVVVENLKHLGPADSLMKIPFGVKKRISTAGTIRSAKDLEVSPAKLSF